LLDAQGTSFYIAVRGTFMRVLIDIGHPAHVHFFRHPIALLQAEGHEVLVTSRVKEMAVTLLDELQIPHVTLSAQKGRGALALGRELLVRDYRLLRQVQRFRPDLMAGIGGIFVAQVGKVTGIPALAFYDTENATLQNALTYPFASCVLVPDCYTAWTPKARTVRYRGYHELSYLHPARFTPSKEVAIANGLAPEGETFLIRLVSWAASHDLLEEGWNEELIGRVVATLSPRGRVLISSESPLPAAFAAHAYRGEAAAIHHVLAHLAGFVGESATMASECAVLGVPAVYAAKTGRGYTDEQGARYGLVKNVRALRAEGITQAVDWLVTRTPDAVARARARLLADTIDVAEFVTRALLDFRPLLAHYNATGAPL
jgi:hypothetical protein